MQLIYQTVNLERERTLYSFIFYKTFSLSKMHTSRKNSNLLRHILLPWHFYVPLHAK